MDTTNEQPTKEPEQDKMVSEQDPEEEDDGVEIAGEGDPEVTEEDLTEAEKIKQIEEERKKFAKNLKNQETEEDKEQKEKTAESRMKFMLQQAEVFAHFVLSKNDKGSKKKSGSQMRRRRSFHDEKEEDDELLNNESAALDENGPSLTRLTQQPSTLKGGKLKHYQLIGLNWMINLYENGVNGILADEMGLGKTIQTISLVAFLREYKRMPGPYLIIGPKSTLGNWFREFKKWLPTCRTLKLIATKQEREEILAHHLKPGKFDVCLATYEGINICKTELKKFHWKYIIIDEAHRIKNEESVISKNLRDLKTHYKLLLTGTPLQNNLHELWSLLNFILPDIFSSSDIFDQWFEMSSQMKSGKDTEGMEQQNLEFVNQLHKILKPFLLRRTKKEVETDLPPKKEIHLFVGLTPTQTEVYRKVLKNKSIVNEDKKSYLNVLMQLRKVCNHPYLFEGVEEEGLPLLGPHLVQTSGKLIVLDKLLDKLRKGKHQVLIFSQMTRMLDILEDYCNFKHHKYCRIDGDTDMESRDRQIVNFTSEDTDKFIFLLSTRAGGLGINLATADTVILYDSDWNPQMDLQAMDRAHRIGQKNPVNVYRMITENTVEEKIVERQLVKLKWDSLVIQGGRFQSKNKVFTKDELKDMIQFGASEIFRSTNDLSDADIDALLERGEKKTVEQREQLEKAFDNNVLDLAMKDMNFYQFEDVDYQKKKKEDQNAITEAFIASLNTGERATRRDKKYGNSYNLNQQFSSMINKGAIIKDKKVTVKLPEFQFFDNRERLTELITKEIEYVNEKKNKSAHPSVTAASVNNIIREADKPKEENEEKKEQDNDNGLTPEENEEKEELIQTGFLSWNKDEFHHFIRSCEKYGRKDYKAISEHIGTKTIDEVKEYSEVFWARVHEIPEYQKHIKMIERGESHIQTRIQAKELIATKCQNFKNPKEDLDFNMVHYNKSRSKFYSLDHDKFLLYACYLEGYGNWDRVRALIKKEPLFKFDHFIKSRTESELHKRVQSLLKVLEKERENPNTGKDKDNDENPKRGRVKVIEEESEDEKPVKKRGQDKSREKSEKSKKPDSKSKEKRASSTAEKPSSKSKREKKIVDEADESQEASEPVDDGKASKSKSREERLKEREFKKVKASIEKFEKGSTKKSEKKNYKQSTLSFSSSKKKADEDSDVKEEDDVDEKIEVKSEASGKSSPKRRKYKDVDAFSDEDEDGGHSNKQVKRSGKK